MKFFVTCIAATLSLMKVVGSAQNIQFGRTSYTVAVDRILTASVETDQAIPGGLFSFGLGIEILGDNGIMGAVRIDPVAALNFNGPFGIGAQIFDEDNIGGSKGTLDFFDLGATGYSNQKLGDAKIASLPAGTYSLKLLPLLSLGATEQLFVSGTGAVLDAELTFGSSSLTVVEAVFDASAAPVGGLALNRQRGVVVQTVRLTNHSNYSPPAFRLVVNGLPPGVRIWNAHGTLPDGRYYFQYDKALSGDESVDLVLEYFGTGANTSMNPVIEVTEAQILDPVTEGELISIAPRLRLLDGTCLLEFTSSKDALYWIQYSENLTDWKTAQPAVIGTGGRVQWFDTGPPRTITKPLENGARYYRIRRVAQ